MRPDDVGRLVDVADPRISPDGATVAYVVTTVDLDANEYRSRVWLAPLDATEPPRPLTSGEHRDGAPRWSPDGRFLAFVSHREEKGSQLYVIPVTGPGEVIKVADWPEEIAQLAWSPDGSTLAFAARQRDEEWYGKEKPKDQPPRRITRFFSRLDSVGWTVDRVAQLFVVRADGTSRPEAVTSGPFQVDGLSWSPDGAWLAFVSGRHETWDLDRVVDLWRVPVDGGEPERLSAGTASLSSPSWSPDGSVLAHRWDEPETGPRHGQIGVLDAANGASRLLTTSLDRNCSSYVSGLREPVWDGGDLVFQVDDGGNVHLYRVPADGSGKPELVVGGDRWVTGFDVRAGTVAFTATDPTSLPELFVLTPDGQERRLTSAGERFADAVPVVGPERFTATAPDGAEVEAWIMRPGGWVEGERHPALLNIHGGPFTQYGNRFFDEFQVQAGAGYVVVYANPRGSSGYTEAWGRAIRGPTATTDPGSGWGGVDYDDLMAVVDEAVARYPFIDPERLGVLGGSYGGYMTSWIVGHTDRFKAACSERAVNDVLALEYASDVATLFSTWVGRTHLDDPEEYRRQSPITYVEQMTTPMLLLHAEDDLRCPVAQAEQLFVALRLLGRDVEFVRFPGESHELSRSGAPRHRVQRLEIILEFFERHLRQQG